MTSFLKWIIGGLATIILVGGTGWLTHIAAQQDALDTKLNEKSAAISDVRERVKGVEMQVQTLNDKADDSRKAQEKILEKLDRMTDEIRQRAPVR